MISDAQFRRLMKEMRDHGNVDLAALRSGMSPNTARKYSKDGRSPEERKQTRDWRTRANPFEADWPAIVERLRDCPDLESKTIFEDLCERFPDRYQEGQLRTLQRHVRRWRSEEGPPKETFFPQEHRPGEAMQTDFSCANKLGITIGGEPFPHELCHPVLPYSNWEWVTVCRSESFPAMKRGVQAALVRLGRAPQFHQTDNTSAATHDLKNEARAFNKTYQDFVKHFSMEPRTIAIGESHQNGDVESSHNAFKRYVKQQLLMRGSNDFDAVKDYERWLQAIAERRNQRRSQRLTEELEVMKPIPSRLLPEYTRITCRVTKWSTIRVRDNIYSVHSRLQGEKVDVHVFDDQVEVHFAGKLVETMDRLVGKKQHRIDYRHVIWSLVRKPSAFRLYRYREDLFPTARFKRAHEVLHASPLSDRQADLEYLRLLHLAASTTEADVDQAIRDLLSRDELPELEAVAAIAAPRDPERPHVEVPEVDLSTYDHLLCEEVAS